MCIIGPHLLLLLKKPGLRPGFFVSAIWHRYKGRNLTGRLRSSNSNQRNRRFKKLDTSAIISSVAGVVELATLLAAARDDADLARLLRRHRRAFRRYAAADNLGEFLDAVRRDDVLANAPAAMVWKPAFSRLAHSSARELSKLRLPKVTTGTASAPLCGTCQNCIRLSK